MVILTNDISGQSMPITVDISFLKNLQVKPGDPIQLTIISRESNTYLALGVEGGGTDRRRTARAGVHQMRLDELRLMLVQRLGEFEG